MKSDEDAKKQRTELASLTAALRAIRPGTPVPVAKAADGKDVTVLVTGVKVRMIEKAAGTISKAMPKIQTELALTAARSADGRVKPVEAIAAILPIVAVELTELVSECVEPAGIFRELEPDQAAPVLALWIEKEILDEGKLKRWKDAFGPLKEQLESMLPEVEKKPTSETSSPNLFVPATA